MDTAGMTREAGCWLLLEPGRDVPSFVNLFAQYTEGYREKVFESLVQWVAGALLEVGGGERALVGGGEDRVARGDERVAEDQRQADDQEQQRGNDEPAEERGGTPGHGGELSAGGGRGKL